MAYNQTTGITTDGPDGGVFDSESSSAITSTNQAKDILDAASLQAALSAESAAESAASAAAALVSENNSDTSEAAALAAQLAAEAAQLASEQARDGSVTAQGLSEAAQAASETAQGLAETAETNAAASAVAALASEGAASVSAGAALTSENNAAASAAAALSSENTSAGYLAAVEAIFDNFDDIYLGAKATDPATDNDGDPLNAGDVYWNTTVQDLRFYNGATWEAPSTSAAASASAALSSQQAAALSAAAALASQNASAASASNSNASAIASEASRQASAVSAAEALASQNASAISEANAAVSEANASTSETNAYNSEVAAAASAVLAGTLGASHVGSITLDMTGFVNRTDSSLSFVAGTRTLTLTPSPTTTIYYRGTAYTVSSALSVVITNSSGGRYIWFNPTTQALQEGTIGDYAGILSNALVAYIYWDSANQKAIIFGDERHAAHRDTQWHLSKHIEQGAVWRSGGNASYTLDTQTAITLGFSDPIVFADEDLTHQITHSATPTLPYQQVLTSNAVIPTLYLSGTSYVQTTASSVPWVPGVALARYNPISGGSGSLADVTSNNYMSYWIVATNDSVYPVKAIMGHIQSNKIEDIEAETFGDYGLPVPELVPMYHIILRVDNAYTANTPHVVISKVLKLTAREATSTAAFSAASHSALAGRGADDQHPIAAITGLQTALDSKEPADATILKDADIGVTVQAYNANYVVDASYVHTDNNFTTAEKTAVSTIQDTAIAAAISMAIALG